MSWKVDYAILGTMYAFRYRELNSRKISSLMNFITDVTCTALGFMFSISTVGHLFMLRHSGKLDQFTRNSDIRLLGHSLAILAIQILYTMMAFHFFSLASGYKSPFSFISDTHRYFEDAYCLVGSPFLLILSSHVREEYLKFYGLDVLQRKKQRTNPLTTILNTVSSKLV
ncbi:hypothetical protein DdX_13156 [Ditylenchus destructor]|uniref:Uncharacterized protein n=1 Tax=Ditylenchus destructor TaxID=166010 RepID=A0AAD4QWQ0_9BILA|nr:hypothetical protein DdX_13156 [Ditylenchus destructor]